MNLAKLCMSQGLNWQKLKFFIKDLFRKCDQIRRKLWILSDSLKEFLMKNFIFCAELVTQTSKPRSLKSVCFFKITSSKTLKSVWPEWKKESFVERKIFKKFDGQTKMDIRNRNKETIMLIWKTRKSCSYYTFRVKFINLLLL